ncbi:uncharacterized protein LOC117403361 [Acipenser ruthenus]|uniref:uncharacterized protein LOC117403361 n=1 Tax=Acipenser ruthenus TaxID=7906 RepID=UPI00145A7504|nr:uncharacterized protein LOC117403361 [Acipenser ruthenus]XP_033861344.3 uncharacterized protein LOC117403361 [Acipenser ruthenus]XP_033861345.3 uncharacterized protein LOC117403361 [Acipenser ruthenus]XP_058880532.1 uncharacterized protein LOC117403361 [Acipenser ruthenus]
MLKTLTEKLRRHSLNESQHFQLKISYHASEDGGESDDLEGENQELVQIDRENKQNSSRSPLATNQLQNQEALSLARVQKLRVLFDPGLDRHSSEEELERISREFLQQASEGRKWSLQQTGRGGRHGDASASSSDEEVKALCGPAEPDPHLSASPSPVPFSASPPHRLTPLVREQARPIILAHFDQSPSYKRQQVQGRPSLDLEKMQQKMLFKKNCVGKTRIIKIRSIRGSCPPPRYIYDPSSFAFHSLTTLKPQSPLLAAEETPCA